ncbi:hypothetical protein WKT22_04696 [Candidatus Lokiarchaeum ossiferum]
MRKMGKLKVSIDRKISKAWIMAHETQSSTQKPKTVNEKIMESLQHPEYLPKIKTLLRDKYGLDVFQYRLPYFLRRISMISKKLNTTNLFEIYNHIQKSHEGYLDFLNTLTIHVTEFFRDKSLWDYLRDELFLKILGGATGQQPTRQNPYRIWSAGCSSGQEPYSLAIMFVEAYKKYTYKSGRPMTWSLNRIKALPFQIIASDINDRILITAQEGIYSEKTLKNADPRIIREYFTKEEDGYHISPIIKEKVTFKQLDLFKGKFPVKFHLVTCRNVVIYFTKDQQRILFKRFWDSLLPKTNMVIGKSELLPIEINKYFKLIKLSEHVYERKDLDEKGK